MATATLTTFGQCFDAVRSAPERGPKRPPIPLHRPEPVTSTTLREVWHHLTAGLAMLSPNDFGRDWPLPRRAELRRLLAEHDPDHCIRAAREAREIAVAQDRAPNITGLFKKKLCDQAKVRSTVRAELGAAL